MTFKWTPDKIALLTSLWRDGYMIKTMCYELGCGRTSLLDKRRQLNLPLRQARLGRKRDFMKINVTKAFYEAVQKHAFRKNMKVSAYVRNVLRRDMGYTADLLATLATDDSAARESKSVLVHERDASRVIL